MAEIGCFCMRMRASREREPKQLVHPIQKWFSKRAFTQPWLLTTLRLARCEN